MRAHLVIRLTTSLAVVVFLVGCGAGSASSQPSAVASSSALPNGWTAVAQPASSEVIATLEGRIAAYNRGDFEAAASYWAEDGVLLEYEGEPCTETRGREAIAARLEEVYGSIRMDAVGTPLQFGRLVAEPVRFRPAPGVDNYGEAMLVFEMDEDGKIAVEYVTFWMPATE